MTDIETTHRNRETVKRFLAASHGGDLDDIDATVAEKILTHGFPGGNPDSRESYKRWFRGFQAGFSDMHFETLATVAEGDRVAVRWRMNVKHSGSFAGVAPSGKTVVFEGMVLYRLENGFIVETWLHIDELSLLSQVGAIPALAA